MDIQSQSVPSRMNKTLGMSTFIICIKSTLLKKIKNFISTEIEWKPLNDVEISKDKAATTAEFLEALENVDDVQRVFTNLKFGNN